MTKTFTSKTGNKYSFSLTKGDIAQVPAEALITAINSGGMWFGGIDGVIMRLAGQTYHNQAAAKSPLKHLDTIIARQKAPHRGLFADVVFIVDDLKTPLSTVVKTALQAAADAGYNVVSLPAIRTGVMLGVVEKDAQTAVGELLKGLQDFYDANPNTGLTTIKFVLYDGGAVLDHMQKALGSGE